MAPISPLAPDPMAELEGLAPMLPMPWVLSRCQTFAAGSCSQSLINRISSRS